MIFQHYHKVIEKLWQATAGREDLRVYAVLDGARSEKIYPALVRTRCDHRCLYAAHQAVFLGEIPRVLAEAAPHLAKLTPEALLTRWLISRGWGDNWGIFAVSSAGIRDLLRHFRRFVMVKDEAGKMFYFRFYDPRVMRVYLPTCKPEELKMIFGPVARYYVENASPDTLTEYRLEDSLLVRKIISVISSEPLKIKTKQETPIA